MNFQTTTEITKDVLEMQINYHTKYALSKWRISFVIFTLVLYLFSIISVFIKHSPYIHILFFMIFINLLAIPSYFVSVHSIKHKIKIQTLTHAKLPMIYHFHVTDSKISFVVLDDNLFTFDWQYITPRFYATDSYFFIRLGKYRLTPLLILKNNLTTEEIDFLQSKVLPKNNWKYKIIENKL